jgi:hypothetical protein
MELYESLKLYSDAIIRLLVVNSYLLSLGYRIIPFFNTQANVPRRVRRTWFTIPYLSGPTYLYVIYLMYVLNFLSNQ